MIGWLIYSQDDIEKNKRYIQFYIEEGLKRNIDIRLMILEKLNFGVKANKWFISSRSEEITNPDFAVCRTIYPLLSKQLEALGIPVFNNSMVAEICNDKARTYQYIASLGISMPDSEFCSYSCLEDRLSVITSPTVVKAVGGHGGNQVFLLKPDNSTEVELSKRNILRGLDGSDAVIQPLIGSRNQDLRVYVIGKDIIGSVLRTAREGFKSNFSLGGEVKSYTLSLEEMNLVKRIINHFDFGMVGIDFIIGDQGELIFNEIEDAVGARMLYQYTNINLVGLYLDYIRSRI
jgi:gamma-F420-2:alpha-L-glutamate ligase